jgi:hypothetical protein
METYIFQEVSQLTEDAGLPSSGKTRSGLVFKDNITEASQFRSVTDANLRDEMSMDGERLRRVLTFFCSSS